MNDFLRRLFLTALTTLSLVKGSPAKAQSQDAKAVPTIKYAGILPVYWQGQSSQAMLRKKAFIDEHFSKIIRESKRFAFLGDAIVQDNWSSNEGRKRLREEFELDGFINLNVTEQGDLAIFTARLLSPDLENYISETERIPLSWMNSAPSEDLSARLKDLSYRVLNRYPIDVFVTSLQGRFLTLSAGRDQNVFEGDDLEFSEVSIKSTHPVDGSWLEFNYRILGKARIIESKAQSSIAQITSLSAENAIRLGSGARVENIASRRNFRAPPKAEEAFITQDNSPIVRAPGQSPKPSPPVVTETPAKAPSPNTTPTEPPMHPAARGAMQSEERVAEASDSSPFPAELKNSRFSIENATWSYSGAASATSKMPSLLVNQVGGYTEFELDTQTTSYWDAHIAMGDTSKGSYTGVRVGAEYLMTIPSATALVPSLDRVLVGLRGEIATIGIQKESSGGMTALHLMPVAHAQGTYHIVEMVETLRYDLSGKVIPLNIGSAGIKGKTQSLGSSMGIDIEAQVIRQAKTQEIEWGGLIGLKNVSYTVGSKTLKENNFRFGLVGQIKL